MNWVPLSPIDLFKVKDILKASPVFVRTSNISDLQSFCENLFMEEIPGAPEIISIEDKESPIGFFKVSKNFPMPGFIHLRILVVREDKEIKQVAKEVISKLRMGQTIWIDSPKHQFNEEFWKQLGFTEEAGRWVLHPSNI